MARSTARATSGPRIDRRFRNAVAVFKGMRMAGHMGATRVTQVGLRVHSIDPEQNLLLVKGAVPGPKNGFVEVREEVRGGGA